MHSANPFCKQDRRLCKPLISICVEIRISSQKGELGVEINICVVWCWDGNEFGKNRNVALEFTVALDYVAKFNRTLATKCLTHFRERIKKRLFCGLFGLCSGWDRALYFIILILHFGIGTGPLKPKIVIFRFKTGLGPKSDVGCQKTYYKGIEAV